MVITPAFVDLLMSMDRETRRALLTITINLIQAIAPLEFETMKCFLVEWREHQKSHPEPPPVRTDEERAATWEQIARGLDT